jgi:hypothetical protein
MGACQHSNGTMGPKIGQELFDTLRLSVSQERHYFMEIVVLRYKSALNSENRVTAVQLLHLMWRIYPNLSETVI